MNALNHTHHSALRAQQRGITSFQLELVLMFGTYKRQEGSSYICFIKKEDEQQMINFLKGRKNQFFRSKNTYNMNNKVIKFINSHRDESEDGDKFERSTMKALDQISNLRVVLSANKQLITVMHGYKKARTIH